MDTNLMKKYVEYLDNTLSSKNQDPKMMIYNSFKKHLKVSIKEKF